MEENKGIRLHSLQQFNNAYSHQQESQVQVCNTLLQDIGSFYRIQRLTNQRYRLNKIQVEGRQRRGKRQRRQQGGNRSSSGQDREGGEDQQQIEQGSDDASGNNRDNDGGADDIHSENIPSPRQRRDDAETLVIQRQQRSGRRHARSEQVRDDASGNHQDDDGVADDIHSENIPSPPRQNRDAQTLQGKDNPKLYTCPFQRGCKMSIGLDDMVDHMERGHYLVTKTVSITDTLMCFVNFEMLVAEPAIYIMRIDGNICRFYVHCEEVNNGYLVCVLLIGDEEVAKKFCYTLEVGGGGGDVGKVENGRERRMMWNGVIRSTSELDDVRSLGDGLFVLKNIAGLFSREGGEGVRDDRQGHRVMDVRLYVKEWSIQ